MKLPSTCGRVARLAIAAALTVSFSLGCHASPDDVAGQAEELSDPVRRQNAITNLHRLYSTALADNDGDRADPAVSGVADDMAEELSQAYIDNPTDNQNRLAMLELMKEMRDPRTIPALKAALDWRSGVNEEHAILAAQTIQFMEVPEAEKAGLVEALAGAYRKATRADNAELRVRVQVIRALGDLADPSAVPVLIEAATKQDEAQDFRVNILAAQQLATLGDERAIPAMIKGLFLFQPGAPQMRMNDVSSAALVAIGRESLDPLLALMRGENEEASALAQSYIDAVRAVQPQAAEQMDARRHVSAEATTALGELGFRDALEPLLAETDEEDVSRKLQGAIALVRLNLQTADLTRVREKLQEVYGLMNEDLEGFQMRTQLIIAMRGLYDPGMIPFFMEQVRDTDAYADVRLQAMSAIGLLANKSEAESLRAWIEANQEDPYYDNFRNSTAKFLDLAIRCDEDIACYSEKVGDSDAEIAIKAAFMLGRLGRGNADAITALTAQLGNSNIEVRTQALRAIDQIAAEGAPEAVAKISELQETEDGRAIWTQFRRVALPTQSRLRARAN